MRKFWILVAFALVAVAVLPSAAAACTCYGGSDYWGNPVDPASTYCGYTVCGADNQYYECTSSGWAAAGGYPCAGSSGCTCNDGIDQNGNPIPPSSTYCGYQTCGVNGNFWECTSSGWQQIGTCSSGSGLKLPVHSGTVQTVTHGYNDPPPGQTCVIGTGPDHCANQKYGFDLGGVSYGTDILAPIGGTVAWVSGDCLGLHIVGDYNLNVCHFSSFAVQAGNTVTQGQRLGASSTTWVHLSIDDRYVNSAKNPIPFTGSYTIEGMSFPAQSDSTTNQYYGTVITSTNN